MKTLNSAFLQKTFDENREKFVCQNQVSGKKEAISYTEVRESPDRKMAENKFYREQAELAAEINPEIKIKVRDALCEDCEFDTRALSLQLAEKFGESHSDGWGYDKQPMTFYALGLLQKVEGVRVDNVKTLKGKNISSENKKILLVDKKSGTKIDLETLEKTEEKTKTSKEVSSSKVLDTDVDEFLEDEDLTIEKVEEFIDEKDLSPQQIDKVNTIKFEKESALLREKMKQIQPGNRIDRESVLKSVRESFDTFMEDYPEFIGLPQMNALESRLIRAENKQKLIKEVLEEIEDYSVDWNDETFFQEGERIMVDGRSFLGLGSQNKYLFDEEGTENDYKIPGNFKIPEALAILNDPSNKEYLKTNGEKVPDLEVNEENLAPKRSREVFEREQALEKAEVFLDKRYSAEIKSAEYIDSGEDFEDIFGKEFPAEMGHVPFLLMMMEDFSDTDLYGYSNEEELARQGVEKTAENLRTAKDIRDSLGRALQFMIFEAVREETDEQKINEIIEMVRESQEFLAIQEKYEEFSILYQQDTEIFLAITANIGNTFEENDDFIDPEMMSEFLTSYLRELSYDDALIYVQESLEKMDDNYLQSDKAKGVYGVFANVAQTELSKKLTAQRQRIAMLPPGDEKGLAQEELNYRSIELARVFTDREADIPNYTENPEFAIDQLEEVLDINLLAEKFSGEELPLRKKTKTLVEETLKLKDRLSEEQKTQFEGDFKLLEDLDSEKDSLDKLCQVYSRASVLKAQITGEEIPRQPQLAQEINELSLEFLRKKRASFFEFLDEKSRSSTEINDKTDISFSPAKEEAFELLKDIAGFGKFNPSDSRWAEIREGTKIGGIILASIAIGIATAGMGIAATAAIAGASMTGLNALVMDKSYGAGELAMEFGVNALSFGAGKALMVGNRLRAAQKIGTLTKADSVKYFRQSLGFGKNAKEATKIALQLDEAVVAGSKLHAARWTLAEMGIDQTLGVSFEATKEMILRGADFQESFITFMKDPTMLIFAGFGLGMNLKGMHKFAKNADSGQLNNLHASIKDAKKLKADYTINPLKNAEGKDISWKEFSKSYEKGKLDELGIKADNPYIQRIEKVQGDFARATNSSVNNSTPKKQETPEEFYKKNRRKPLTDKDRSIIEQNRALSDDDRLLEAEKLLGKKLTNDQEKALLDAHHKIKDNTKKAFRLKKGGFDEAGIFVLMRKGLAGKGAEEMAGDFRKFYEDHIESIRKMTSTEADFNKNYKKLVKYIHPDKSIQYGIPEEVSTRLMQSLSLKNYNKFIEDMKVFEKLYKQAHNDFSNFGKNIEWPDSNGEGFSGSAKDKARQEPKKEKYSSEDGQEADTIHQEVKYSGKKLDKEILYNYQIENMQKRFNIALAYLKRVNPKRNGLLGGEKLGIEQAHNVGQRRIQKMLKKMNPKQQKEFWNKIKNGEESLYTREELAEKVRILRKAGFDQDERAILIRKGVCGFAQNIRSDMGTISNQIGSTIHQIRMEMGGSWWRIWRSPTIMTAPIRLLTSPLRVPAAMFGSHRLWGFTGFLRRVHNFLNPVYWTSGGANILQRIRSNWNNTRGSGRRSWYYRENISTSPLSNNMFNLNNWETSPFGNSALRRRLRRNQVRNRRLINRGGIHGLGAGFTTMDMNSRWINILQNFSQDKNQIEGYIGSIDQRIKRTTRLLKNAKRLSKQAGSSGTTSMSTPEITTLNNELKTLKKLKSESEIALAMSKKTDAEVQVALEEGGKRYAEDMNNHIKKSVDIDIFKNQFHRISGLNIPDPQKKAMLQSLLNTVHLGVPPMPSIISQLAFIKDEIRYSGFYKENVSEVVRLQRSLEKMRVDYDYLVIDIQSLIASIP